VFVEDSLTGHHDRKQRCISVPKNEKIPGQAVFSCDFLQWLPLFFSKGEL
jgi:hypothetical protein